jgi:hypothetical protein
MAARRTVDQAPVSAQPSAVQLYEEVMRALRDSGPEDALAPQERRAHKLMMRQVIQRKHAARSARASQPMSGRRDGT